MKDVHPICPNTEENDGSHEWIPETFADFLKERDHIIHSCHNHGQGKSVLFRGHRKRTWLLDSTFVRSFKHLLLGIAADAPWPPGVQNCGNLQDALLNLYFAKYLVVLRPSEELMRAAQTDGIDPWFELMKIHQQYPETDPWQLRGCNLLDWTVSSDVALFFANRERDAEGAVWICDAAAMGKAVQTRLTVHEILMLMESRMKARETLGCPLIFHPRIQRRMKRAENQGAVYVAQMDMRYELGESWRGQEETTHCEQIALKLVLPADTEREVAHYLETKGITKESLCPPEETAAV